MANTLTFSAVLKDEMSRAAKAMAANLRNIPTSVKSTYTLNTYADVRSLVTLSKWMNVIQQRQNAMNTGMLLGMKTTQRSAAQMAAYSASVQKSLGKALTVVKSFSTALQLLVGVGLAAGVAGIVLGFTAVSKKIVNLNSEFETFQTSLRTTLGSLAAAKREMADIVEFARVTPYEIAGVTDAFVKLRAYALDPNVWATAAGDMAAAFGKPMIKAVEAIADASRGEFKRLREFGFVFHVTDFKKGGQQAGKTYAEAVFEAISTRFKGGMKLQSQTYAGIVSNLKDTITIAMVEAGKPMFDAVKAQAQRLLDYFDTLQSSGTLSAWVKKFQDGFAQAQDILARVTAYVKTNWLPIAESLAKSIYKVGTALVDVFAEPVIKAILAIVTSVGKVVAEILELVTASDSILRVIVTLRVLQLAFKSLSVGVKASAVEMVALGKATSTFSASAGLLAKRLLGVVATLTAITGISKFTEFKNNIKSMASDLGTLNDIGLDKVKQEIIDIADASGLQNSEIARAGVEAVKYGDQWNFILRSAAAHAESLGVPVEQLVNTLGRLGEKLNITGAGAEVMAIQLERLKVISDTFGVDTDAMLNNLEDFPELLESGAYQLRDWVDLMETVAASADVLKDKLGANYWKELLSGMDLARTPSLEMLIGGTTESGDTFSGLNNDAFITQSIENAKSLEDTRDAAILLEDTLREVWDSLEVGAEAFDEMLSSTDNFKIVVNTLNILQDKATELEQRMQSLREEFNELTVASEKLQDRQTDINITLAKSDLIVYDYTQTLKILKDQLEEVNDELAAIEKLQPTGTAAFNNSIYDLEDSIARLQLKELRFDLEMIDDAFADEQRSIDNLNKAIAAQERALEPLQNALKDLEDQFTAVSESISKAQADLDKFTNPKLEGMGEFDDKLHSIDMQLTELERKRIDVAAGLKPFEDAGLTSTDMYKRAAVELDAIDQKMGVLEDARTRTELNRSIAYDDQLYQLGKISDREKEITFDAAVAGATEAVSQLDKLEPQLDNLGKQVDVMTEIIDEKQKEIDAQQTIVEKRQEELDLQKDILSNQREELSNNVRRLELAKQILEAERNISLTQHDRAMEALKNGPISEASTSDIQSRYADATSRKAGLENEISTIEGRISKEQTSTESLRRELMEIGIAMSENGRDLVDVERKMNAAENELLLVMGQIKGIVTGSASIITGIDPDAFMKSSEGALRAIFGDDYYAAMDSIINGGGLQKQTTTGPGGPVGEGPGFLGKVFGSEVSIFKDIVALPGNIVNTLDKWWTEHPVATGLAAATGFFGAKKAASTVIPAAAGKVAGAAGRAGMGFMEGLIGTNYKPLADINDIYRNGGYDELAKWMESSKMGRGKIPKWLTGEASGLDLVGKQFSSPNLPNLPEDLAEQLKKAAGESADAFKTAKASIIKELESRVAQAQPPKTVMGRVGAAVGRILPGGVSDAVLGNEFIPEMQFNKQQKQVMSVIREKSMYNSRFARQAGGEGGFADLVSRAENSHDLARILEENSALRKAIQKSSPEIAGEVGRYSLAARQVVGGGLNVPLLGKPVGALSKAIKGPGGVIPRLRQGLYSSASIIGTVDQTIKGEGVKRAVRYAEGQQAGGLLRRVNKPLGIVSPGAQAAMDIGDAARGGNLRKPFQTAYDLSQRVIGAKSSLVPEFTGNAASKGTLSKFVDDFKSGAGKLPSPAELTKFMTEKIGGKPTKLLEDAVNSGYKLTTKSGTGVKGFIEKVLPKAKDLGSGFKKWTAELPFNQVFDTIGEKMGGKGAVKAVGKGLSKALKYGLSAPVDIVTGSYDLQKLIRKIPGWDEFLSGDSNPLVKVMDGLFAAFGDGFGNIFLKITDPILSGAKALEQLILVIEKIIEVVIEFVFGVGKSLYEFFDSLFHWDWDEFGSKIKDNFSGIWDTIKEVWEHLKEFWTYFKEYWGDLWELIKDPFEAAWAWISSEEGPKGWPGKVWGFIAGIGVTIGEHVSEAADWVAGLFGAAWDWINSDAGPKGWPGRIWGLIVKLKDLLVEKAGEIVQGYKDLFGKVWDWLNSDNGPKGWPGKIVGWISSIPGRLGELGQTFFDAGKAVIEKLGDGMAAGWEWLKDHVPGLETLLSIGSKGVDLVVRAAQAVSGSFMEGGIATGPESGYDVTLHGTEAVIPLKSGYIPVKITGDSGGGRVYKTEVTFSPGSIVVRDNEDMDRVIEAINDLKKGLVTFSDKAITYAEGY